MGAVAIANAVQGVVGDKRTVTADVTMSASYATGGDTVSTGTLGLRQVDEIHVHGGTMAPTALVSSKGYTPNSHGLQLVLGGSLTAPKLKAFFGSSSEVANATNLSAVPAVRVVFLGS